MNRRTRTLLVIFSFVLAVLSMICIIMFISEYIMSGMIAVFLRAQKAAIWRNTIVGVSVVLFVTATFALIWAIMDGRLRKARVRESNLGSVDIGVDAIESIALNAAKASQSGVKSAKARVSPCKGDKLSISLNIATYSDVELPAMMSKVQERVKKDIERYTGIEVAEVRVKVARVDAVSARVEH